MRNNDDIIRVLNEERTKQNLSISELSRRVGMAKSALSRYFNKTREFPLNKAEDFASALGITSEYLLGFEEASTTTLTLISETTAKLDESRQKEVLTFAKDKLQEQEQANDNVLQFPVSKVIDELEEEPKKDVDIQLLACAGHGTLNFDKENPIETVVLPENNIPSYYDYACKIVGSSMEPMYHDGEVIFLRKSPNIRNNMIAVVEINDQCFLKKMTREGDKLRLISLNDEVDTNGDPLFPDFYADANDDIYIVGEVIK